MTDFKVIRSVVIGGRPQDFFQREAIVSFQEKLQREY